MCYEQSSDREGSSKSVPEENARLIALYQQQAKGYDQSGIHGLDAFRREAVRRLELKRGDLVVDLGCGTGLNFPWLQEAIGETGRIIGVDLTDAMLEQARLRVGTEGWKNVELVQADATHYQFPTQVNGILSTFALTFVPDGARVIQNGCRALAPGRRPWQTVWSTMQQSLVEVERQPFWMGFFYLAWGTQPQPTSRDGTAHGPVTQDFRWIRTPGALDERGQPSAQKASQHHPHPSSLATVFCAGRRHPYRTTRTRKKSVTPSRTIEASPKKGRRGLKMVIAPPRPSSRPTTFLQTGQPTEKNESNAPPNARPVPAMERFPSAAFWDGMG